MIKKLIERISAINIDEIFDQIIKSELGFILDLIRLQLLSGERADGTPIGTYSKSKLGTYYVNLKFDKGLFKGDSYPNYDLYFTGTYHKGLTAIVTNDFVEIKSTDPKEPEIEMNTGSLDNALTLNENNMKEFINKILPLIQKKLYDSIRK